jgi:Zn-dependent protease
MVPGTPWSIPYIPDPGNLAGDVFISFIVSALLAIMINAEAQAWVATLLGDTRPEAKDRFHFNVLFHMSFTGSLNYLVAGFGWPKTMDIDATRFRYPKIFLFLSRLAGPMANILLANIAASLVFGIKYLEMDPLVFMMVLGVNVTTAVYHLLPIPPLTAGAVLVAWLPSRLDFLKKLLNWIGPFLIVAIFLLERLTGVGIISPYFNPLIETLVKFIRGG